MEKTDALAVRTFVLQQAPAPNAHRLLETLLSGKKPHTVRAYRAGLERFREFLGLPDIAAVAEALLGASQGDATYNVIRYQNSLIDAETPPATINSAVTAIRALVKAANSIGLVSWRLKIPKVDVVPYRDTAGPGHDAIKKALSFVAAQKDKLAVARDTALICLLYNQGLRRNEAVSMNRENFNKAAGVISIVGKGRRERESITLNKTAAQALGDWVDVHPDKSPTAPLFCALDRAHRGCRLSGEGVRLITKRIGEAIGVRIRPHGLRHTAITEVLNRNNGNVLNAAKFSRHRDLKTIQRYDDNRMDAAKQMSDLLVDE